MKTALLTIAALTAFGCGTVTRALSVKKEGKELRVFVPDRLPEMEVAYANLLCRYTTTEKGAFVTIPCLEEAIPKTTSGYKGTEKSYDLPNNAVGVILFGKEGAMDLRQVCEEEEYCVLEGVILDTNGGVKWQ